MRSLFFDAITITLPAILNGREERRRTITARVAQGVPHIKTLTIAEGFNGIKRFDDT